MAQLVRRAGRRRISQRDRDRAYTALVERVFDRLAADQVRTLFVFSQTEPLYDELERQGRLTQMDRWPGITIEQLPTTDHEFRALAMQRLVSGRIDRAIDEMRSVGVRH